MSFQPLLFTWYSSIPRTIEADCAFVYEFELTVWCTNAKCTPSA